VRRSARLSLIVIAVLSFLAVSALLARGLSATGVERAKVLDVVEAQAAGTPAPCSPSCPTAAPSPRA
jgi:hypothetical protein